MNAEISITVDEDMDYAIRITIDEDQAKGTRKFAVTLADGDNRLFITDGNIAPENTNAPLVVAYRALENTFNDDLDHVALELGITRSAVK